MNIVWSAILAFAVSFPVIRRKAFKGEIETEGQCIVREAAAAGRTANGQLKKSVRIQVPYEDRKRWPYQFYYLCTYNYIVDGVVYTFRARLGKDGIEPPEHLTFYYPEGKPQKAISRGSKKLGARYSAWVLLPLVLWVLFYWILP